MNPKELVLQAVDDTGFQLEKCFDGITGDQWNQRVNEHGMTPLETLGHLSECYVAFGASCQGQQHSWGTYQAPSQEPAAMLSEYKSRRQAAVDALKASDDDGALTHAVSYIVLHDPYHVGQLCNLRLQMDPAWDAESIYR